MRLLTLLVSLSVLLLAGTCQPDAKTATQMKQLERTWLHAHEEDQGDVQVYRPNTYAFPPSRGRTGFRFERNSLFIQYDIALTDGLIERRGTWTYEGKNVFRISLKDPSQPGYRVKVVAVSSEVLRLQIL